MAKKPTASAPIEPTIKRVKLTSFKPAIVNPNVGNPGSVPMIVENITMNGAGRSMLADRDGEMVAGSHSLQAFIDAGFDEALVIESDGKYPIIHQRTDVDIESAQGRSLQIGDNRTTVLGYVQDNQVMAALLGNIAAEDARLVQAAGFDDAAVRALMESIGQGEAKADPGAQVDKAGALAEEYGTATSQIWQLGRHRLAIGDCTDKALVAELMQGEKADAVVTDPPYGMNLDTDYSKYDNPYEGKFNSHSYTPVIGDNKQYDPTHIFELWSNAEEIFLWGADYFAELIPHRNEGSWLVWDKRDDGNLDAMFGSAFELCWSKKHHKREIIRVRWGGVYGTETQDIKRRIHPTQKPIQVMSWIIETHCRNLIVDPFLGSGTTLIACEQTGRTCYAVEIEPKYAAVAIQRWEALTNMKAERTHGRT